MNREGAKPRKIPRSARPAENGETSTWRENGVFALRVSVGEVKLVG
jgi:hypothetical protein